MVIRWYSSIDSLDKQNDLNITDKVLSITKVWILNRPLSVELLPLCKKPPKLILVPIWYVHSYSNLVSMCTWVSNSSPHVLFYNQARIIIRHLLTPILFSETRQIVQVGCVLQLPVKKTVVAFCYMLIWEGITERKTEIHYQLFAEQFGNWSCSNVV